MCRRLRCRSGDPLTDCRGLQLVGPLGTDRALIETAQRFDDRRLAEDLAKAPIVHKSDPRACHSAVVTAEINTDRSNNDTISE